MHRIQPYVAFALLVAAGVAACPGQAVAAPNEKEAPLIGIITSDAKPPEKALACKRLAIHGSEAAVPALARLLGDKELASWTRIALEAIPGPAADKALLDSLDKLEGKLLVGAINSIAVRRVAKATDALVARLKDPDAEVACASGEALGRIGGTRAVKALRQALGEAPPTVRSAVAYGCVLCAERMLQAGKADDAAALYDQIRKAEVPEQRMLEATRGAILARGVEGAGLLIEQLKSRNKELFGIGLRTARELPGEAVTEALVAELGQLEPQRRALLLLALADRGDPKALPAMLAAVKSGPTAVRVMAMGTLEKIGDASCVPVLLEAAIGADAVVARKARITLGRLPAGSVDADIAGRISTVSGKQREILIQMAGLRRVEAALPAIVQSVQDTDPGCRAAAVAALGSIGGAKQVGELVAVLGKTTDPAERAGIDKALRSLCARVGAGCTGALLPLAKSSDAALRPIGLHALVCAGGAEALAAIKAALDDKDAGVQEEAIRTLANWPSNWPEDTAVKQPLLALAKGGKTPLHRILALRGYLQHLQGARKSAPAERLAALKDVLPLVTRPEEKRLAVSALSTIPAGGALDLLAGFATDRSVAEEACGGIVALAREKNLRGATKAQRKAALEAAVKNARNGRTKRTAQGLLRAIK